MRQKEVTSSNLVVHSKGKQPLLPKNKKKKDIDNTWKGKEHLKSKEEKKSIDNHRASVDLVEKRIIGQEMLSARILIQVPILWQSLQSIANPLHQVLLITWYILLQPPFLLYSN